MVRKRAVLLLVLALLSLGTAAGYSIATLADTPLDPMTAPTRPAQVRIFDLDGGLLFSTWPHENGTILATYADYGAEEPEGPIASEWERWPAPLHALVPLVASAPRDSIVRLDNVTLAEAPTQRVVVPRVLDLPMEGTLTHEEAKRMFGYVFPGLRTRFIGAVPLQILSVDDEGVRYALDVRSGFSIEPYSVSALRVVATPLGNGVARFELDAPLGAFAVTAGCKLLGPQDMESGYYLVDESTPDSLVLTRYPSGLDHAVGGERVALEVTFLDSTYVE